MRWSEAIHITAYELIKHFVIFKNTLRAGAFDKFNKSQFIWALSAGRNNSHCLSPQLSTY